MRTLTLLRNGLAMGHASHRRRLHGWKQYPGDAKQICEAVVRDCWNGTHFMGSAGHYRQFWVRDYGMCVEGLLRMGYREECRRSLRWALGVFQRRGHVTTTLFPGEEPEDIYTYAVDTLPYLLRSLRLLQMDETREDHRDLLEREIARYRRRVWDPRGNRVRPDRHFSGAKDCVNRRSACHDNAMVALLHHELKAVGLPDPWKDTDFPRLLTEKFWTGTHFKDDLSSRTEVTADANITPHLYPLIEDEEMLKKSIRTLQQKGMDRPFPIRHTERPIPSREKLIPRLFAPNYQGDTVWTQLGPMFIHLVRRVDPPKAREYIEAYRKQIERHRNYLELFNPDGTPYRGHIYYTDEGMIWAAMMWELL